MRNCEIDFDSLFVSPVSLSLWLSLSLYLPLSHTRRKNLIHSFTKKKQLLCNRNWIPALFQESFRSVSSHFLHFYFFTFTSSLKWRNLHISNRLQFELWIGFENTLLLLLSMYYSSRFMKYIFNGFHVHSRSINVITIFFFNTSVEIRCFSQL